MFIDVFGVLYAAFIVSINYAENVMFFFSTFSYDKKPLSFLAVTITVYEL